MANEKYDAERFCHIARVMSFDGAIDKEMCEALGITKSSFYRYQEKYPEFKKAVNEGKRPANAEVKAEAFRRCLGFDYEENEEIQRIVPVYKTDKEGNIIYKEGKKTLLRHEMQVVALKTTNKKVLSDPSLIKFWLMNRDRDNWNKNAADLGDLTINVKYV